MFHLPADNPFTPAINTLVALAMIKSVAIVILTISVVWFGVRLRKSERRQDRILLIAEDYAKLGADRKEIATTILTEKTKEVTEAVGKIPVLTSDMTLDKIKEVVNDSMHPETPKTP